MSRPAPEADIFAGTGPRLFSIEAGRPFLADLARAVAATAGGDPLALADVEIFVPTRRAARALIDAFVAAAPGGRASLLPRIRPLGDVDEDELALEAAPEDAEALDLAPAISSLERRLILARFVAVAERASFNGQENWPAALAAAKELAALLDSFYAEEIDFSALAAIDVGGHAAHWARALDFLKIATQVWPDYLRAGQLSDPAERRAALIDLSARRFARLNPQTPVIVAGTTGSAPAVARLMSVVARLPKGAVVLPGLDFALAADEKAWKAIDDPHPQAGLKALLERLGLEPSDVKAFPGGDAAPRRALLSLALRPAEATDDWRAMVAKASADDPGLARSTAGLSLVEAADEESEANAIALKLREAIETPGLTAMLVTPDRNLSRRVAAKMRRWRVAVDDSAGIPFANSPCGTYLRLSAAWLAAPSDPAAALAFIQHPLAGLGLDARARRQAIAAFDEAARGLVPFTVDVGTDSLAAKIAAHRRGAGAAPVMAALEAAARAFPQAAEATFGARLNAHLAAAELIAATADEEGALRLWRGEDGEAGALLLAGLKEAAASVGAIAAGDYAAAFAQMIAGAAVRRRAPAHPRLSILGPLEARLQSADLVILGGLNEGVWPGEAETDPFLSRPMRKELGLPSPERRVGLAAHDFAQLAAAPRVVLTRAIRAGGAPSKPSRWIVRLRNILEGAGALPRLDETHTLAAWAKALDTPGAPAKPVAAPRPRPPFELRPRALYVTRIERWLRDPYAIYAQYILRLEKLDPLNEPFGPRHLGSLFHKVFETYARHGGTLDEIFARFAPDYGYGPSEAAFFAPAVADTLSWFEGFHAARRALGAPAVIEGRGELALENGHTPFTIKARADRIDLLHDGAAAIFDYKSRRIPSKRQAKVFDVQLPLTALIVEGGGFAEIGARKVAEFAYLRTMLRKDKDTDNETGAAGGEAADIMRKAGDGLKQWVAAFDDPDTPYLSQPRPQFLDEYGDYNLLARRREWCVEKGEE